MTGKSKSELKMCFITVYVYMCIVKGYLVSEPLLSERHSRLRLVVINEDLLESEAAQIGGSLLDVLEVLCNN